MNDIETGIVLFERGKFRDALAYFQTLLEMEKNDQKIKTTEKNAIVLTRISMCMVDLGTYQDGMNHIENALKILEDLHFEEQIKYFDAKLTQAVLWRQLGKFPNGLAILKELKEKMESLGLAKELTYARILQSIGLILYDIAKYDESIEILQKAQEIFISKLGRIHWEVAETMVIWASVIEEQGNTKTALKMYEETESIQMKTIGKEHSKYAITLKAMGWLLQSMGKFAEGQNAYTDAANILEKTLGKNHSQYAGALNGLGWILNQQGKYTEALKLLEECRRIREAQLGKFHPQYSTALNNLASVYLNMHEYDKAIKMYEETRDLETPTLGSSHPHVALTHFNLAICYRKMKKWEKAIEEYEKCLEIQVKVIPRSHIDHLDCLADLSMAYAQVGKQELALQTQEKRLLYSTPEEKLEQHRIEKLTGLQRLRISILKLDEEKDLTKRRDLLMSCFTGVYSEIAWVESYIRDELLQLHLQLGTPLPSNLQYDVDFVENFCLLSEVSTWNSAYLCLSVIQRILAPNVLLKKQANEISPDFTRLFSINRHCTTNTIRLCRLLGRAKMNDRNRSVLMCLLRTTSNDNSHGFQYFQKIFNFGIEKKTIGVSNVRNLFVSQIKENSKLSPDEFHRLFVRILKLFNHLYLSEKQKPEIQVVVNKFRKYFEKLSEDFIIKEQKEEEEKRKEQEKEMGLEIS